MYTLLTYTDVTVTQYFRFSITMHEFVNKTVLI